MRRHLSFNRDQRFLWLLVLAGCCCLASGGALATRAWAQEAADEPAMEAEEPAEEEPAADEPAEEPVEEGMMDEEAMEDEGDEEKPKPKPTVKPKTEEEEEPEPVAEDPAVLTILESKPATPAQLLRAIDILVDLDRAAAAKPFVESLAKAKLKPADKAALAHQFNSAILLKLAHDQELGDQLAPFVDDLMKSAEAYRRDPARLVTLVKQLQDPNEAVRAQATLALIRAREGAVAPLVDVLADPKRAAEHKRAEQILVQLGDLAAEPLLGVLDSDDDALKTKVVKILGHMKSQRAVSWLLAPLVSPSSTPQLRAAAGEALMQISGHVPQPAEAMRLLDYAARRPLNLKHSAEDRTGWVDVWQWDPKKKASVPVPYDAGSAQIAMAARLARQLWALNPNNADYRRLYLMALLEGEKTRVGLDNPLPKGEGTAHDYVAGLPPAVIEDVLARAMADGFTAAATAAAQILGEIGSAELLAGGGQQATPLALAAQSSDRHLRFAAMDAILRLKPTQPFAGSSHVADALGFFASSYGTPRVLVVHPRTEQGQQLAGFAAELGYETDLATNGRRAFQFAVRSPDYEFILIHSTVQRSTVDELVAQLRRDPRTALLPIGLIAPLYDIDRVKRFARSIGRAEAFLQPDTLDEMKVFSGLVLGHAGDALASTEARKRQSIAALDWMIELGKQPHGIFDLAKQEPALMRVLYNRELTTRVATVLGQIASVHAQRALVELAHSATQPLDVRQAAVAAFRNSVDAHGIMLTTGEITQAYDLYNTNAGRDADTHAVLASILDIIEHKDSASAQP